MAPTREKVAERPPYVEKGKKIVHFFNYYFPGGGRRPTLAHCRHSCSKNEVELENKEYVVTNFHNCENDSYYAIAL